MNRLPRTTLEWLVWALLMGLLLAIALSGQMQRRGRRGQRRGRVDAVEDVQDEDDKRKRLGSQFVHDCDGWSWDGIDETETTQGGAA